MGIKSYIRNKAIQTLWRMGAAGMPEQMGNNMWFPVGWDLIADHFWAATKNQFLKDFNEVPEVNAVINLKARAKMNMVFDVVNKATQKPVPDTDPIAKVIRTPNYFQSQTEFTGQSSLFFDIFGNEYIYKLWPTGFPKSIKAMFALSDAFIEFVAEDKGPYWLNTEMPEGNKYYYTWNGSRRPFENDTIIHINSVAVAPQNYLQGSASTTPENYLQGASKLSALQAPIRNIRAAYEARNVIIVKRGALGIFTNDTKDGAGGSFNLDPDEKDKLQEDIQKYGLTRSQKQFIFTNLALKFQQIGIDVDKLQLLKETETSFGKICDSFGTPKELFSSEKGVTFANRNAAEKDLYLNTIIPESQERVDALNRGFDMDQTPNIIIGTFPPIESLQEDLKIKGQAITLVTNALSKAFMDKAISIGEYQETLREFGINFDK